MSSLAWASEVVAAAPSTTPPSPAALAAAAATWDGPARRRTERGGVRVGASAAASKCTRTHRQMSWRGGRHGRPDDERHLRGWFRCAPTGRSSLIRRLGRRPRRARARHPASSGITLARWSASNSTGRLRCAAHRGWLAVDTRAAGARTGRRGGARRCRTGLVRPISGASTPFLVAVSVVCCC